MRLQTVTVALCILAVRLAGAGPHDATSHQPFGDVEHWQRVFDDPARDAWQKPQALVAALEIRPGMAVADLGAGTGYLSRYLAAAVGRRGTVFAVETEPRLLEHLRRRAELEHTSQVVPVLGSTDDPRLPTGRIDLVVILDTYHHIDGRLAYFRRLRRILTPLGRVAIIDWHKRELPVGPAPDHKLAREQVVGEMQHAGWTLTAEYTVLSYQYFLVFRPRA